MINHDTSPLEAVQFFPSKPSIWKAHPYQRTVGYRLARQYPTLLQIGLV
jgi:hypothetical protein